jgi:hypothetical protein
VAVAAEAEQDDLGAALLARGQGFIHRGADGVRDSGAGRMPSVRANWTAASNTGSCE